MVLVLVIFVFLLYFTAYMPAIYAGYLSATSVKHAYINRFYLFMLAVALGIILAFLTYSLAFFAVATLNHSPHNSNYGHAFFKFYQAFNQAFPITWVLTGIFTLVLILQKFITSYWVKFLVFMAYGYQIMFAILTICPVLIFAKFAQAFGIIDLALNFFAQSEGIDPQLIDIKSDLTSPSLGFSSHLELMVSTGLNFYMSGAIIINIKSKFSLPIPQKLPTFSEILEAKNQ